MDINTKIITDQFALIRGESPSVHYAHKDRYGVIARITGNTKSGYQVTMTNGTKSERFDSEKEALHFAINNESTALTYAQRIELGWK